MNPQVRYQVFLSSTYEDLREERQQATQAILEAGFFPSGMELFPASDDTQWELIKKVIEESDYYLVIVGGRYGSLGPSGTSYTEMEYDYAVEIGVPVLGFVRNGIGDVAFDKTEKSELGRQRLELFRQKVLSRTCRRYSSPQELGMAVIKSLMSETRLRPRTGWVRADQARSDADVHRERKLVEELEEAHEIIEKLDRIIRDGAVLSSEVSRDELAQGDDLCQLTVTYLDENKKPLREDVGMTWDEIFKVIGPSMYGLIQRKVKTHGESPAYEFEFDLKEYIRGKILDRVQGRKINLKPHQIDQCIMQFKELGLLRFEENEKDNGEIFRGITLTALGEQNLMKLSTTKRPGLQ